MPKVTKYMFLKNSALKSYLKEAKEISEKCMAFYFSGAEIFSMPFLHKNAIKVYLNIFHKVHILSY